MYYNNYILRVAATIHRIDVVSESSDVSGTSSHLPVGGSDGSSSVTSLPTSPAHPANIPPTPVEGAAPMATGLAAPNFSVAPPSGVVIPSYPVNSDFQTNPLPNYATTHSVALPTSPLHGLSCVAPYSSSLPDSGMPGTLPLNVSYPPNYSGASLPPAVTSVSHTVPGLPSGSMSDDETSLHKHQQNTEDMSAAR